MIYIIFAGNFVQSFSEVKNYLYILIIGVIFYRSFNQSFGSVVRDFVNLKYLTMQYIFTGFSYILFLDFFWDVKTILYILLGYFTIPLILGYLSIDIILYVLVFSLVIMFSSYSLALITSPLFIYVRKESQDLIQIVENLLSIIIPTTFMASYFFFYKFTILIPPIVLIEEFRKILLGIEYDWLLLIEALVISIIYFLLGWVVFTISFNYAKRKGWVRLI